MAGQYCPEGSAMWRSCPGGQYCADVSGLVTGNCTAGYYCIEVGLLHEVGALLYTPVVERSTSRPRLFQRGLIR